MDEQEYQEYVDRMLAFAVSEEELPMFNEDVVRKCEEDQHQ